jgi:hypothetical protein
MLLNWSLAESAISELGEPASQGHGQLRMVMSVNCYTLVHTHTETGDLNARKQDTIHDTHVRARPRAKHERSAMAQCTSIHPFKCFKNILHITHNVQRHTYLKMAPCG